MVKRGSSVLDDIVEKEFGSVHTSAFDEASPTKYESTQEKDDLEEETMTAIVNETTVAE